MCCARQAIHVIVQVVVREEARAAQHACIYGCSNKSSGMRAVLGESSESQQGRERACGGAAGAGM